jgi:hypothetical protein
MYHLVLLFCALSLASCAPMGFTLSNVNPQSEGDVLIVQPSILAVDIPKSFEDQDVSDVAVEVLRKTPPHRISRETQLQATLAKDSIGNGITQWNVNIAPKKWKSGGYRLRFSAPAVPDYELEADFRYEFFGPGDY